MHTRQSRLARTPRRLGRIRGDSAYPAERDARGRVCIRHTVLGNHSIIECDAKYDNGVCCRLSIALNVSHRSVSRVSDAEIRIRNIATGIALSNISVT